jgi:glycosyl transferase, family 25
MLWPTPSSKGHPHREALHNLEGSSFSRTVNSKRHRTRTDDVVPVVVISLATSADRRAAMRRNLDDLSIAFTFFDAVDGRAMSADDIAAISPRPYVGQSSRPLSAGEIGCAASLRAVLTVFLDGTDSFLCVAEDDASFAPDVLYFLDPTVLRALPPFDVMRLHNDARRGVNMSRIVAVQNAGYAVHAPLRLGIYSFAQVYTRAGAKAVISGLVPLTAPIDNLIYRDVGILGLRVLEVRPAVVVARGLPSTIGDRFKKAATRRPRGLIVILRRKIFMIGRRLRAIISYTRAWGASATLHIRAFPMGPTADP